MKVENQYMSTYNQNFILHPVGQGLFCSGEVSVEEKGWTDIFTWVFDCGSLNKGNIEEEVQLFREENFKRQSKLELLVISHFDQDHVNYIGRLLDGDIKVKKIVLPFLPLSERLFLVLRILEGDDVDPDRGKLIELIIDPVGVLSRYLDDDGGQIILIDGDPDNPPFGLDSVDSIEEKDLAESNRIVFSIPGVLLIKPDGAATFGITDASRVWYTKDSNKGYIFTGGKPFIEFLFYRKSIGEEEEKFYKVVWEKFIKSQAKRIKDKSKPTVAEIVEVVKGIRHATLVKRIFKSALEDTKIKVATKTKVMEMNTTALCLLHACLPLSWPEKVREDDFTISVDVIEKPDGTQVTRVANPHVDVYRFPFWEYYHRRYWYRREGYRLFPNCILTSDCFLLERTDVEAFYNRYQHYWFRFWIFQIPHHGSRRNVDATLLSRLHFHVTPFVNFGVNREWPGRWTHPSPDTMNALTATALSAKLLPVNEYKGFRFRWSLHK